MMPHPLGLAVLCGLLSGALFMSLLFGLPGMLLVYFAQLPVLFAGLTLGLTASGIAALGAIVVIGLMVSMAAAVGYVLLHALPAVVTVRQALLRRTDQGQDRVVSRGAAADPAHGPRGARRGSRLRAAGRPARRSARLHRGAPRAALSELGLLDEATPPPISRALPVIPRASPRARRVMVMVNFMLAQALAVRPGWARRPSAGVRSSWSCRAGCGRHRRRGAAACSAGGIIGDLGWSLLIVLVVPYLFLGLALVHVVVRRWSRRRLALGRSTAR